MTEEFTGVTDSVETTDDIHSEASVPGDDEVAAAAPPVRETFGQYLRRRLWPSRQDLLQQAESRLRELEEAIEQRPEDDAPSKATHHILRGELFLKVRAYEQALAEFQQALALTEKQIDEGDWGVIAQILQDRAWQGFQRAQRGWQRQQRS
ncbi:MAG: tetratricopeptide repeat protein [bacterium]|nr:tetratricopeptide repeat protein [bacterium]